MDSIETQVKPQNSGMNRILKMVSVLLILAVIGATGMYIGSNIEWRPALKLTILTEVNESDGSPTITNITFEQVSVFYKGTDSKVDYPDISVMARSGSLLAPPASYWVSVPWNEEETSGNYTLTVTFRDFYKPTTGDVLILTIRQTGTRGYILNKITAFYEWQ